MKLANCEFEDVEDNAKYMLQNFSQYLTREMIFFSKLQTPNETNSFRTSKKWISVISNFQARAMTLQIFKLTLFPVKGIVFFYIPLTSLIFSFLRGRSNASKKCYRAPLQIRLHRYFYAPCFMKLLNKHGERTRSFHNCIVADNSKVARYERELSRERA